MGGGGASGGIACCWDKSVGPEGPPTRALRSCAFV
ncbi:DUF6053 domain-containing protein [Lysobacter enzymogenes]